MLLERLHVPVQRRRLPPRLRHAVRHERDLYGRGRELPARRCPHQRRHGLPVRLGRPMRSERDVHRRSGEKDARRTTRRGTRPSSAGRRRWRARSATSPSTAAACPARPARRTTLPPRSTSSAGRAPATSAIPAERCTGVPGEGCPPDVVANPTVVCRAGSGDACDPTRTARRAGCRVPGELHPARGHRLPLGGRPSATSPRSARA
jgi:hypothetical protein